MSPPDSASRAQYHSLCKKTSTKPMMSESRREFGSLWHSMNMVGPWSQYVSRAGPTNYLALYKCVGTTPCSSMASWRRTTSLCHYQRTWWEDWWHTLLFKSGPRWCLQPDRARTREPETFRPEHTQRGPFSDAASIWHQLCYRVLPRCHEPAHKWPSRSRSLPGRHPDQWEDSRRQSQQPASSAEAPEWQRTEMSNPEVCLRTRQRDVPRSHHITWWHL